MPPHRQPPYWKARLASDLFNVLVVPFPSLHPIDTVYFHITRINDHESENRVSGVNPNNLIVDFNERFPTFFGKGEGSLVLIVASLCGRYVPHLASSLASNLHYIFNSP